jgi:Copper amine oxidase N-terminal domain/WXXGXW repeat (2 copies)
LISTRLHFPLASGVAGAIFAFILLLGAPAQAQVSITINGNPVNVYPAPIIQTGRVFVPLRGVFETLGASVVYSNGQINATGNGNDISLQIGSTQATVNGSPQTIDVAPFIIGASTYVPLRFVSQALGAGVAWDNANQVVEITMADNTNNNENYNNNYNESAQITTPPPPIPDYEQPPVPAPNYIWMPGYWAWGDAGYYWVPGTWVPAPQPGYLWTPGYWGWQGGYFGWHQGYWATAVGFYGGVNYGAGYYGNGYAGGRWSGNAFSYNTAVTRVTNTTVITNVYVNETVVNNNTVNHVSYNGGPNGIAAKPTQTDIAATHARHLPLTAVQQQHVQVAAQDRELLATVNAGKPPVVVAPEPYTPARKPAQFVPVTPEDKQAAKDLVRPAPARPPVTRPVPPPAVHPAAPPTVRPAVVRPETGITAPPRPEYARPTPPRPAVIYPTARPAVYPTTQRPAVYPTARPAVYPPHQPPPHPATPRPPAPHFTAPPKPANPEHPEPAKSDHPQ